MLPPISPFPEGVYQWDAGAGTLLWDDAANWSHPTDDDAVPPAHAAVLFGELAGASATDQHVISASSGTIEVDSLWFDAEQMGPSYTLSGSEITLGTGGAAGGDLISVKGWQWSRETRIFAPDIKVHASVGGVVRLTNESYAGLLIEGGENGTFDVGGRTLQIRGGGLTHIASSITGMTAGNVIDVQGHRTQLILNASNQAEATLSISNLGAAVIKNSHALGAYSKVNVGADGTLILRSATGYWDEPVQLVAPEIRVAAGAGAARRTILETGEPTDFAGAIYNDGGDNAIESAILGTGPAGDVVFNSRAGNLTINGLIDLNSGGAGGAGGAVLNFVKDGAGSITLNRNAFDTPNTWGQTTIRRGELRIGGSQWALSGGFGATDEAAASVLHFAAAPGVSAVLGMSGWNGERFTRQVGTGVYWTGSGGFFARGGDHTVALTNSDGVEGGLLHWHRDGFMGDWDKGPDAGGHELQLGSEGSSLVWENEIDFGTYAEFQPGAVYSRERTVNVLEGLAEMQGALHGEGFDFAKRGEGVLRLTSVDSDYAGAAAGEVASTRIYDGGLEGAANNLDFTNIVLAGGVYMPNTEWLPSIPIDEWGTEAGIFDITLGTGAGQFRWDPAHGGGFAGSSDWDKSVIIRIGDPTAALAWGDEYFVASGHELILGHALSSSQLIWDKALDLGSASQTIRAAGQYGGATITQSISGGAGLALNIVGDGFLALTKENTLSRLNVAGAQVYLDEEGTLIDTEIYIREGGILTMTEQIGQSSSLGTGGLIDLSDGGRLQYLGPFVGPPSGEIVALGKLRLSGGAVSVDSSSILQFSELERAHERTTLRLGGQGATDSGPMGDDMLEFITADVDYAEFENFFPWATFNDTMWVSANADTGRWTQMEESAVNMDTPSTWTSSSHVRTWDDDGGAVLLDQSRTIRSLITLGDLDLQGHTLTLGSGGLIMDGYLWWDGSTVGAISGGAGSALTTGAGSGGGGGAVPLYVHVRQYGEIGVALTGGMDLVKAGSGMLSLTGNGHSQVGAVFIHEGRLELNLGREGRFHTTGRITVGDRSSEGMGGEDVLRLPKYDDQITGSRDILLRGGDYGAGVLEFARNEPEPEEGNVFRGASHHFNRLEVEGRGVIDFSRADVGVANYLYLDELIIDEGSLLSVRNWVEGESFLLVRNTAANQSYIRDQVLGGATQRIQFEGYDQVYTSHYNDDYFEITPFPRSPFPEPSTYGAIFGALGLAVVVWRRRKQTKTPLRGGRQAVPAPVYYADCDSGGTPESQSA